MSLDPASADHLRRALGTVAAVPVTPFGADRQADSVSQIVGPAGGAVSQIAGIPVRWGLREEQ